MKKSKYSDSQFMAIIKQTEAGTPVPELCREHGMSSASSTNGAVNTTVLSESFSPNISLIQTIY